MDELTEADVRKIEQIHSSWIEFEVAGEDHNLMALCADDIELWPPDAQPLLGRAAVSARMAPGNTRIHCLSRGGVFRRGKRSFVACGQVGNLV